MVPLKTPVAMEWPKEAPSCKECDEARETVEELKEKKEETGKDNLLHSSLYINGTTTASVS